VLLIMAAVSGVFFTHACTQTAPSELKATDVVNPAWVLLAGIRYAGGLYHAGSAILPPPWEKCYSDVIGVRITRQPVT
jgi:hypothetical protein